MHKIQHGVTPLVDFQNCYCLHCFELCSFCNKMQDFIPLLQQALIQTLQLAVSQSVFVTSMWYKEGGRKLSCRIERQKRLEAL